MKILEFAETYCSELIRQVNDDVLKGFKYDELIQDTETGAYVKVLDVAGRKIPIVDILGMSRDDFAAVWPDEICLRSYDNYMKDMIILEGMDVIMRTQRELSKVRKHLISRKVMDIQL